MAQVNPDICGQVSYTHPSSNSQSAARAVRYLTRRPEPGKEASRESEWQSLPAEQIAGDPEGFKEAANERRRYWRDRAEREGKDLARIKSTPRCTSYIHVVISPARREEYRDEDLLALAEPYTRHPDGTDAPFFAAVHRDSDHTHLHVLSARDKVEKQRELPQLQRDAEELMRERERDFPEPEPERDRGLEQEREPGRDRERGRGEE